jgi:hypothetical protein
MDQQQKTFAAAASYTQESIGRCKHLAEFIKKRQQIEDEYAKALRRLCKSVSLTPMQQQQQILQEQQSRGKRRWWWPFGGSSGAASGDNQTYSQLAEYQYPLESTAKTYSPIPIIIHGFIDGRV